VAYLTPDEFAEKFSEVVQRAEANESLLMSAGREAVDRRVFTMMIYAILCTKHPAFAEEREWRAIYRPTRRQSPKVTTSIEVIRGVAQPVCKLDLKDRPDLGLVGLDVSSLVDRVIIGPTNYPAVMAEAFMSLLTEAGVKDAANRVWMSNIPLRQD
jgi:hypothetical protein